MNGISEQIFNRDNSKSNKVLVVRHYNSNFDNCLMRNLGCNDLNIYKNLVTTSQEQQSELCSEVKKRFKRDVDLEELNVKELNVSLKGLIVLMQTGHVQHWRCVHCTNMSVCFSSCSALRNLAGQ